MAWPQTQTMQVSRLLKYGSGTDLGLLSFLDSPSALWLLALRSASVFEE